MLFIVTVNYLSLALGYTKLLLTFPLLVSFNLTTLVLAVVAYRGNKDITFSPPHPGLSTQEKLLLIIPVLFPLLSIVGMRLMNTAGNNILLMFLLFLIPAYLIFIAIYQSKIPERLYPGFIYLISVS